MLSKIICKDSENVGYHFENKFMNDLLKTSSDNKEEARYYSFYMTFKPPF